MLGSNILLYTTEDGLTKIEATFENDTVQLSLAQMAELFQRDKSTISRYIKKIFEKRELDRISVVANFATTTSNGKTYQAAYYNLEEPAKNYLNAQELDALNKIVSAYLDIVEVRAINHEPMYMKDWLETIDGYLKMTRREILLQKEVFHINRPLRRLMQNMINIKRNKMNCYQMWKKILFIVLKCLSKLKIVVIIESNEGERFYNVQ